MLRYVELHNLRPEAEAAARRSLPDRDAPARPSVEEALATCDRSRRSI